MTEDCSFKAHEKLKMPYSFTKECVEQSFSNKDWASPKTVNYLIDQEIDYWNKYGSGLYPSIVINNKTFRGQLDTLSVFNALCAGFATPPKMCEETLGIYTPDVLEEIKKTVPSSGKISGSGIVLLAIGVILLNVVIVYCYRRQSKREVQTAMQV